MQVGNRIQYLTFFKRFEKKKEYENFIKINNFINYSKKLELVNNFDQFNIENNEIIFETESIIFSNILYSKKNFIKFIFEDDLKFGIIRNIYLIKNNENFDRVKIEVEIFTKIAFMVFESNNSIIFIDLECIFGIPSSFDYSNNFSNYLFI